MRVLAHLSKQRRGIGCDVGALPGLFGKQAHLSQIGVEVLVGVMKDEEIVPQRSPGETAGIVCVGDLAFGRANPDQQLKEGMFARVTVLANASVRKTLHHAKYDLLVLERAGFTVDFASGCGGACSGLGGTSRNCGAGRGTSTGATRTLKVSGMRETAGQSSISMMENRVLQEYQAEARGRGESDCFAKY